GLASALEQPDFVYLAPQAAGNTWYPYSFLYPIEQNQPGLDSGLLTIADLLTGLERRGLPAERVMLLGFSQGACLAQEFAARNARRYGGIVGLSGGVIGPDGTPRHYPGSLAGTPVLIGCSDIDPHIPLRRVEETAEVFTRLGAQVDKRIYPGMGHTVNQDEVDAIRAMMTALLATRP
ncbi:MAG: dienelactone hydrolase family protein, partial [Anaerolineae bacterium]|nr:dienelactone hydrolase family protein [Anaerolineae bacterium]